jgi:hypothetical protein
MLIKSQRRHTLKYGGSIFVRSMCFKGAFILVRVGLNNIFSSILTGFHVYMV